MSRTGTFSSAGIQASVCSYARVPVPGTTPEVCGLGCRQPNILVPKYRQPTQFCQHLLTVCIA